MATDSVKKTPLKVEYTINMIFRIYIACSENSTSKSCK